MNNQQARSLLQKCCVLALAMSAALLIAGPLDPPAGPVSPTYKTLSEVEPRVAVNSVNTPGDSSCVFRITQAGSYYLTGNLASSVSGKVGIEIAASNVTLDLHGFVIDGTTVLGAPPSLDGIRVAGAQRAITIKNGVVRDFAGTGIAGSAATGLILTDITVDTCGDDGIETGPFARVDRCAALTCAGFGISIPSQGATVTNCTAANNELSGLRVVGAGARVQQCTAYGNGQHGIEVSGKAMITENTCMFNGTAIVDGAGIRLAGAGAKVTDNQVTSNDHGILAVNDQNLVYHNWASHNTVTQYSAPSWHGFANDWNISMSGFDLHESEPFRNFTSEP